MLMIAKVEVGKNLCKAIVVGDGINYAEKMVKYNNRESNNIEDSDLLDLEGLECRWDKIKPPEEENEVVCYLIEALDPALQIKIYGEVIEKMEEFFGTYEERNPLSVDGLKLLPTFKKIKGEMMIRFGKWKRRYFVSAFIKTLIGRFFIKHNLKLDHLSGQEYLQQVINNADILTIDGRINTIISGKKEKRLQFMQYLSQQEMERKLVYGHFISKESVMTCYIEDRNAKHIHFVDGADGGYTEASKELKKKLRTRMQND